MRREQEEAWYVQLVRKGIRLLDGTINLMVLLLIPACIAFGSYAIWDSNQVHQEAAASQYEPYKPTERETRSFAELRAMNPDVFGWLTVYGTNIDYPLVQGEDNETYVNTSVTGETVLSGSLFLDYRNQSDFSDFNSIIYGHHMMKQVMFGEIGDFQEWDYFQKHQYGNLFYNGRNHGIEFFAFLAVDAYDNSVYMPAITGGNNQDGYLANLSAKAMHIRTEAAEEIRTTDRIVLLSTCSSEFTNGRHILVGRISDQVYEDPFPKSNGIGGRFGDKSNWLFRLSLWK